MLKKHRASATAPTTRIYLNEPNLSGRALLFFPESVTYSVEQSFRDLPNLTMIFDGFRSLVLESKPKLLIPQKRDLKMQYNCLLIINRATLSYQQ